MFDRKNIAAVSSCTSLFMLALSKFDGGVRYLIVVFDIFELGNIQLYGNSRKKKKSNNN